MSGLTKEKRLQSAIKRKTAIRDREAEDDRHSAKEELNQEDLKMTRDSFVGGI